MENNNEKAKTLGETRIRTDFNPGNNDRVQNLKEKFAHLINEIDALPSPPGQSEAGRLKAIAMTTVEEAAMWAVKAATA